MPRYRLVLEYDGSGFVGWQRQDNGPSVQAALERAVHGLCGETVAVTAAGRTDAGVHASGQVVHLDLPRPYPADRVRDALNHYLKPDPVAVLQASEVGEGFHARFDATARHYRYEILNRRAPPVLDRHRVWHLAKPLDSEAMAAAAALLVGHHDFSSFRSTQCQAASPLKTLDSLTVARRDDRVVICASARSFLHNQVRIMTGSLAQVGLGRWPPARLAAALAARDRKAGGPTAPPQGLCLVGVDYAAPGDRVSRRPQG
ncbi:tRNA pseudouridine(38-40) synthase TruA [Marinibaculum pumilum]|uniref:tRNA pseudouridine synthase A n=1 Tax=Marinibaculum pumilum TaxID=1766165 RepID=A0ABV7L691_9PROT